MTSLPAAVTAGLSDGVARVGADGVLAPCNEAMRALCARVATGAAAPVALAAFGIDGADAAALRDGEVLRVRVHDCSVDLRLVRDGDANWLVATDVTGADGFVAASLELVRLRALAGAASGVVHDLNNLLNAALGLGTQLEPFARDAADRRLLQELGSGTRQGAQLLRSLARLLSRPLRDRVSVPVATLVDEATGLAAKSALTLGATVTVEPPVAPVVARTVVAEAMQALWHGVMAALERGSRRLVIASDRTETQLARVRTRSQARVRVRATGLDPAAAQEIVASIAGAPGLLASSARSPIAAGLAVAVFAQRRLGGDLAARALDDGVELEYRWPAVT